MTQHRTPILHAVMVALSAPLLACSSNPEEEAVLKALDELVAALQAKDMPRLWALADSPSKSAILATIVELEQAQALIPSVWEAEHASAAEDARVALGQELLEAAGPDDAGRGPRVLGHLLDPSRLTFDQGVLDGLAGRDIIFDPGPPRRAIVHTSAGEVFPFVDDGGAWRTLLVRDLVLEHPHFAQLRANAKKTRELAGEAARLWQASLDPKAPHGAYNLARRLQTASPPDWRGLHAMLDTKAHEALARAMEQGRAAQKKIQQRVAKNQRKDAYDQQGIALLVESTSDRDLYLRWTKRPDFVPPLPATDEPARVEGDPAGGAAKVVTASGRTVAMVRDAAGFWRIAGAHEAIEQALLEPAKKVLAAP